MSQAHIRRTHETGVPGESTALTSDVFARTLHRCIQLRRRAGPGAFEVAVPNQATLAARYGAIFGKLSAKVLVRGPDALQVRALVQSRSALPASAAACLSEAAALVRPLPDRVNSVQQIAFVESIAMRAFGMMQAAHASDVPHVVCVLDPVSFAPIAITANDALCRMNGTSASVWHSRVEQAGYIINEAALQSHEEALEVSANKMGNTAARQKLMSMGAYFSEETRPQSIPASVDLSERFKEQHAGVRSDGQGIPSPAAWRRRLGEESSGSCGEANAVHAPDRALADDRSPVSAQIAAATRRSTKPSAAGITRSLTAALPVASALGSGASGSPRSQHQGAALGPTITSLPPISLSGSGHTTAVPISLPSTAPPSIMGPRGAAPDTSRKRLCPSTDPPPPDSISPPKAHRSSNDTVDVQGGGSCVAQGGDSGPASVPVVFKPNAEQAAIRSVRGFHTVLALARAICATRGKGVEGGSDPNAWRATSVDHGALPCWTGLPIPVHATVQLLSFGLTGCFPVMFGRFDPSPMPDPLGLVVSRGEGFDSALAALGVTPRRSAAVDGDEQSYAEHAEGGGQEHARAAQERFLESLGGAKVFGGTSGNTLLAAIAHYANKQGLQGQLPVGDWFAHARGQGPGRGGGEDGGSALRDPGQGQ